MNDYERQKARSKARLRRLRPELRGVFLRLSPRGGVCSGAKWKASLRDRGPAWITSRPHRRRRYSEVLASPRRNRRAELLWARLPSLLNTAGPLPAS